MIKELSNYFDSIRGERDYLLFTEGKLPQGYYYCYDPDENETNGFKLSYEFEINKKNEIQIHESADYNDRDVLSYLKKSEFLKKLFLSRTISNNKTIIKQIYTANPCLIYYNADKLLKLYESLDTYYNYCGDNYLNCFQNEENKSTYEKIQLIARQMIESQKNDNNIINEAKDYFIYFNMDLEYFQKIEKIYIKNKIFNNTPISIDKISYGLSAFLNGNNQKKRFQSSVNAIADMNSQISFETALKLNELEYLLSEAKGSFPNPLPVFIYAEQLNKEVITLFNKGGKRKFREIIGDLYERNRSDFSNYYLLNWNKGRGLIINDFDYVGNFEYEMKMPKFEWIISNNDEKVIVNNIFDFELKIVNPLFSNLLITGVGADKESFHYFDDLSNNKFFARLETKTVINNLLRYRYSLYEYIYKSKKDVLTGELIYNLAIENSCDLIFRKTNPYRKSAEKILDILFNINEFFDKQNKNFGGRSMPSELKGYFEKMEKLKNDQVFEINDDYLYAFAAGQVIYYILSQSQSSEKSHAMFEPFINKTDINSFNDQLVRIFNQYKHALGFNYKTFNKLLSEVLAYKPEAKLKELTPVMLTGYLANNIFYSKSEKNTKEEDNE